MTHDDITLAFRMLARGMPNHDAVTRLADALAAVMQPEPPAANPPTPAPKSDSIPLSRPRKR